VSFLRNVFLPGIASRQEKAAISRRTPIATNILLVKAFFVQQETKTAMFDFLSYSNLAGGERRREKHANEFLLISASQI